MRKFNLSLGLLLIMFLVVGCKSSWYAETKAKEFHRLLSAEKYDKLENKISEEGLDATPAEDWIAFFKDINRIS